MTACLPSQLCISHPHTHTRGFPTIQRTVILFSGLCSSQFKGLHQAGASRRLGSYQAAHQAKGDGVVHRARKPCLPRQLLLLRPAREALDGGAQVPAGRQVGGWGSRRGAGQGGRERARAQQGGQALEASSRPRPSLGRAGPQPQLTRTPLPPPAPARAAPPGCPERRPAGGWVCVAGGECVVHTHPRDACRPGLPDPLSCPAAGPRPKALPAPT